jgi:hypothetical protein
VSVVICIVDGAEMDLAIVFLLIFNINVSHTVKLGAGKNDAPFLAFVLLCTFAVWD